MTCAHPDSVLPTASLDLAGKDIPGDREALVAEILSLRETNRRLNRRANAADAHWQSRAMKAEHRTWLAREMNLWKREFDRAGAAFAELRDVYLLVEAARGRPQPAFHSVNDCCHPSPGEMKGVYANVYVDPKKGGVRHERVVDAVRQVLADLTRVADGPAGSCQWPKGSCHFASENIEAMRLLDEALPLLLGEPPDDTDAETARRETAGRIKSILRGKRIH
jgi:hypothetical protein